MLKNRFLLAMLCSFALLAAACGGDDTEAETNNDSDSEETDNSEETDSDSEEADSEEADSDSEEADSEETDSDSEEATNTNGDFPVTIESDGGTWTLEAAPERIVSLSPMATEILFAIGAGDQVVAVDAYSNFPPEAPTTDLSGFDPNVEAITAFEPDLVVIANDANELIGSLTELGIPVLVSSAPTDIESGYASMADLGLATGHVDETAAAITSMREEVDAAFATGPEVAIRVYHELDETYYSASSFGFVGAVYAELGAENIADEADADQGGFPQLTEEYIVEADPQLIVITDQVAYTADDVAARPGWEEVDAVKNDNVVVVNADTASRWGPRLPEFITAVAEALSSVPVG